MVFIARLSAIALFACVLASCGGGGGGGSHSSTPVPSTGSGTGTGTSSGGSTGSGGSGSSGGSTIAPIVSLTTRTGVNVTPVSVNAGLSQEFPNLIYVTVTVCAPNSTTNCVAIPNVQVDTGSVGLRVLASKVQSLGLTPLMSGGSPLAECAEFADGSSWGAVKYASVNVGGTVSGTTSTGGLTTTTQIPIQVVDDTAVVAVNSSGEGTATSGSGTSTDEPSTPEPEACSNGQLVENSAATLGANGIIGVGYFQQDCGIGCTAMGQAQADPFYYSCPAASCSQVPPGTGVALTSQVSNPISSFPAGYNNGNSIDLPTVPDGGASVANGYLVFGVSTTLANNPLPAGAPLSIDDRGNLTVAYNGTSYPDSFIDSGSSVYFFNSSIAACGSTSNAAGFYCPASEYTSPLTTITGNPMASSTGSYQFNFKIGNALDLFDSTTSADGFAFDNLGAPNTSISVGSGAFDVGEPFFYGRSVFTVIEGQTVGAYTGPFAAVGTAS